jgi:hypothetical protein
MQAERVVRVNEAVMRKLAGVETAARIEAVGLLAKPPSFVSFLDVQLEAANGRMAGDSGASGAPSSSGRSKEPEARAALLCSQPSCYMAPQDWCPGATRVVALDGIQVRVQQVGNKGRRGGGRDGQGDATYSWCIVLLPQMDSNASASPVSQEPKGSLFIVSARV